MPSRVREAQSSLPKRQGNGPAAAQSDFVMTLDSDDDMQSVQESEDEEEADDDDEKAKPSAKNGKQKASLATYEKVRGLARRDAGAAGSKHTAAGGSDMKIDKAFEFDAFGDRMLDDVNGAWDMSVKGAKGQNGAPVTVDDIIERKRASRKPGNDLDFTSFGQDEMEEDEDEDEEVEEAIEDSDADSDAESDEFGAGVVLPSDEEGSDDDEEEDNSDAESEADQDIAEAAEEDSDEDDSEEETEVEKAKKAAFFAASEPESQQETKVTFETLSLSRPIMRALSSLNFHAPTPIQAKSIPIALAGKDIVAGAVTGSGKTAAFLIPILERLSHRPKGQIEAKTRVLILMPTRELAVQCVSVGRALAKFMDVRFCLCVGGLSLKVQESQLKDRPDIVVATPGRLIDHVRNSASFGIDDVEILVMDEADRMLEEGFRAELDEIVKVTPVSRQTMLFSATMTDDVDELVRLSMKRPAKLFVDPRRSTAQKLVQEFVRVRGATGSGGKRDHADDDGILASGSGSQEEIRSALLLTLCMRTFTQQVIIFVRSKKLAHQLRIVFGLVGLSASELHGDLSQEQRLQSLQAFRDGKVDFLLATDLASRGLDIKGVQTVINYDMPQQLEMYLHRVGRTARAGRNGRSVTLVGEADRKMLKTVLKRSPAEQIRHRLVPTEVVSQTVDRLHALRKEVSDVLQEEKEEKLLRQAEMEATKGENMIKHQDEIMGRPRRTWFVGAQDKASQKNLAKLEYEAKMGDAPKKKHDKFAGLSRKQKRLKMAREEIAAESKLDSSVNASIRAAKKANRPKELGVAETYKGKAANKTKGKSSKPREKSRSSTQSRTSGAAGGSFKRDLGSRSRASQGKGGKGGRGGKGGKGGRRK